MTDTGKLRPGSLDLSGHRALIDGCLKNRVPFFWRTPGTMLIRIRGLPDVLRDVLEAGFRISGLEGFYLEGDLIAPQLDLTYDAGRDARTALEALVSWPEGVWVDVTLSPRDTN